MGPLSFIIYRLCVEETGCEDVFQDRVQLEAFSVENFFTSWETFSLSRWILCHGVSYFMLCANFGTMSHFFLSFFLKLMQFNSCLM